MPRFPPAGYSGTPLAKKLGLRAGSRVHLIGAPAEFRPLLEPLPDGVRFEARLTTAADVVHVFATRRAALEKILVRLRAALRPDAAVWVSWPKQAAKLPTDLSEDAIRAAALPLGFVDIKVCAVGDVWSGLNLVIRKALR